MASSWLIARLRECIVQLISRQTADDAAPGTDRERERQSDATLEEAMFIHRTLTDHADEIEQRLADRRVLSALHAEAQVTRQKEQP